MAKQPPHPGKRVPQLRQHHTGVWFVRYGGKDHYLYRDYEKSLKAYPDLLTGWAKMQVLKEQARLAKAKGSGVYVCVLVDEFLDEVRSNKGKKAFFYYRKHLRRFNGLLGKQRIAEAATLRSVYTFSSDSLTRAVSDKTKKVIGPKTIKHDIDAVKKFLRWCVVKGYLETLPDLTAIRAPAQKPPLPEPLTLEGVTSMIGRAEAADARLGPWLRLNYLAVMRVSEVKRLVHQEGVWLERGVFVLEKSKMVGRTGVHRHIILSEEALEWLGRAERCWPGENGYYKATVRACGPGGPHVLRDSAATHLLERGVPLEDVELLLGHIRPGAWRSYARPSWQLLREKVALLSLR